MPSKTDEEIVADYNDALANLDAVIAAVNDETKDIEVTDEDARQLVRTLPEHHFLGDDENALSDSGVDDWGGYAYEEHCYAYDRAAVGAFAKAKPGRKVLRIEWAEDLTDQDLETVVAAPAFASVEYLNLNGAKALTDAAVAAIIRRGALSQLRILSLRSSPKVGDRAVIALAQASMPVLEGLALYDNAITDAALAAIARSKCLPSLRCLAGGRAPAVNEEAVYALHDVRPQMCFTIETN